MAFDAANLKKIATGGAVEQTFPDPGVVTSIYHYVTNDLLSLVEADGYFDGIPNDPLVKGDLIMATIDADGTPKAKLYVVTVGGGDVTVAQQTQST